MKLFPAEVDLLCGCSEGLGVTFKCVHLKDQRTWEEDFCKFEVEQKRKSDSLLLVLDVRASKFALMVAVFCICNAEQAILISVVHLRMPIFQQ